MRECSPLTTRHMSSIACQMSLVKCHVPCVTRHVLQVTYLVSSVNIFYFFFFGQSIRACRWRVCYQRGLPRLVSLAINHGVMKGEDKELSKSYVRHLI